MRFRTVPYSEAEHASFVFSEIRRSAHKWPYTLPGVLGHVVEDRFVELARRCIVSNPRGCVVTLADSEDDLYLGYCLVAGPQRICHCYTKYSLRHLGVCTDTLSALGLDFAEPIGVELWSPAASRICQKGYRLFPVVTEQRNKHEQKPRGEPSRFTGGASGTKLHSRNT